MSRVISHFEALSSANLSALVIFFKCVEKIGLKSAIFNERVTLHMKVIRIATGFLAFFFR